MMSWNKRSWETAQTNEREAAYIKMLTKIAEKNERQRNAEKSLEK